MSTDEVAVVSGRVSNKGKHHRPRNADEMGEIYLITNTVNGKKYIGQALSLSCAGKPYGSHARWMGHLSDARCALTGTQTNKSRGCRVLSAAINKHGGDKFDLVVLLQCGADQLDAQEAVFIDLHNTLAQNGRGYNLKSGGNSNGRAEESTRLLMSEAHRGEKHHYFGVARSEETRMKIAQTLGRIIRYDFDGVTILPCHMKTVNDSGTVGYMILAHDVLPSKIQFSSKKSMSNDDVMATLRAKCVFYLEHLNACAVSGVTPTPKKVFMQGFSYVVG